MARWQNLPEIWKVTFAEAVSAYVENDSAPIGSVVTDSSGSILSRGHNAFAAKRLAHAEMSALDGVPLDANRTELSIYSTLEPCPMCTGAIRMFQLGAVHFAARDPSAGSTELLNATTFMRAFPCNIVGAQIKPLEMVVVALLIEYRERTGHHRWRERWLSYQPSAFQLGCRLSSNSVHSRWVSSRSSAEEIFDEVASELAV